LPWRWTSAQRTGAFDQPSGLFLLKTLGFCTRTTGACPKSPRVLITPLYYPRDTTPVWRRRRRDPRARPDLQPTGRRRRLSARNAHCIVDNYWTSVFPSILVIALEMAGAVAPLTTAVLMSVDARHPGSASGFNSAVARTGGLVATALIGSVMIASGPALRTALDMAAIVDAATCVAASLSAFFWINLRSPERQSPD
jgi:hypothetical protein